MTARHSIYSAPRDPKGIYRFCDDKPIYRRQFASMEAMLSFWQSFIVPISQSRSGMLYELSMIVEEDGKWGHHGQPRYADIPYFNEKYRVG